MGRTTKIKKYLFHPTTKRTVLLTIKISTFVFCVGYIMPWVWHNILPPMVKLGNSYLDFVSASILSYILISSWIKKKNQNQETIYIDIDDQWFEEEK